MNYLAHLSLAQPTGASMTGNLMADFNKYIEHENLPEAITKAMANHRAVDRFNDHHEQFKALRQLFSADLRRYSGIVLDVVFDHFLARRWAEYHHLELEAFSQQAYALLLGQVQWMPTIMAQRIRAMARDNWLPGYRDIKQVEMALASIGKRMRFANKLHLAMPEVVRLYDEIDKAFMLMYPQIQAHVQDLDLER